MNADRWHQIDRLFQTVVELEPMRRAAFLDESCSGDPKLRTEVESLLANDSREWDFLERPALETAASLLADEEPQLAPGQSIDRYQIIRLIGRGGMGEVYLAKDQILNRKVALKLLPVDYIRDKDRLRRLQQEAYAASALNHPNILTIYELGMADEQQFIALEFVDGETLRQRLLRGAVSLPEALDIAIQTGSALVAAHEAGIVHRDIKPENLMLRPDGYVKVLDFGLAKLTEPSELITQSRTGEELDASSAVLMGTLRYMSPEQARGLPVDPRSDIFSLGIVLFEMVSGHAPFQGDNAGQLIESILNEEPPLLDVSVPELLRVLDSALAKRKEGRYQTTLDLINDLKALKEALAIESRPQTSAGVPIVAAHLPARVWGTPADLISRIFAFIAAHETTTAFVLVALTLGAVSLAYLPQKGDGPPLGTWIEKAPMLRARQGAAVAALNNEIFVASGSDETGTTNALESYDSTTDKWSVRAPIPTARAYAGAAGIDGKVYVFGGCSLNSEGNEDCRTSTTNVLEAYDVASNTWSKKRPMPTARSHIVSAVISGKLFIAGGRGACPPCEPSDKLEVYDPVTDSWDETKAPMLVAAQEAGGATLNGKFYVAGGEYPHGIENQGRRLQVYDPITDKWTLEGLLPTPRTALGLASSHGRLYAISGLNASGTVNLVEAYDPDSHVWTTRAPIPTPRVYPRPVSIAGTIYETGSGGSQNEPVTTLEAYQTVCPGSNCYSAPPGLVGWWAGDGNTDDLARSNGGNFVGQAGFDTGKDNLAFKFDGSSFVTMGNPAPLNLGGSQVTIDGWVKPSVNLSAIYFGKTEPGSNDYLIVFGNGVHGLLKTGRFETVVFGYADFPNSRARYIPPINQWTHVALTYDGNLMKLYANGTLIGQEHKSGNISADEVPFNIGGRAIDNGTGKFRGLIDEVEVFNRALSETEIQGLFASGSVRCKPQFNCS